MKNQVITEITRQMLPYLDNAQMEHLQEVLQHCLWNVEITSSGKNTELFVRETNEEMLEMFLSAKRVEGCSEKTLRYYETSLLRMFSEVDMHVTKMKTDDLRNYLSEYQQRTQCSRGNIDNIRRILSSFFAWLEDENYILKSPVRRIHKIRSCKTVKETYTDEALETMRDQCGSIRDLAKTKFLDDGIHYDELSQEDKERYEEDFAIDGILPDFVSSTKMNKFVFNEKTVDGVLQDLMGHGIHVAGGDRLGKTIIFAQNKKHAEYIIKRFNALYPKVYIKHPGDFAQRVICDDSYSQTIIDDFKNPEKPPYIAVSVDMMDTGIDVPECVNLVFFKKVRSKAKFWQMIGRGTRLCKGLNCIDQIEGEYTDKRRFLIFDYCNNFEFFRAHKEGYETKETKSLSENIFGKRIKIAAILQETAYAAEDYQSWREELTTACRKETEELDMQLVAVKLNGQYVRKYIKDEAFRNITESDKGELLKYIAPLVKNLEKEEYAKRFDNFMYGLIYADMEALQEFERAKNQLCDIAGALETKISIPQIKEKIELIREINTKEFWEKNDIILFEKVRRELRGLLKFLDNKTGKGKPIITKLTDPVLERTEGNQLDGAYDFENYRDKVNRYVNEHGNTLAIHKLTHNIPLSSGDYQELERVFTIELGSREDYQREFGDTPFGLLIRKIARLDHEAVMEAFSAFINDESLNMRQIAFINKVITYIENNGYMENVVELQKPPFDKPISFIKLFDTKTRASLLKTINDVKDNAVNVIA